MPYCFSLHCFCNCIREQKADKLYKYSLYHFNTSVILHVLVADYLRYTHNNVPLEILHLACAEVGSASCCVLSPRCCVA